MDGLFTQCTDSHGAFIQIFDIFTGELKQLRINGICFFHTYTIKLSEWNFHAYLKKDEKFIKKL